MATDAKPDHDRAEPSAHEAHEHGEAAFDPGALLADAAETIAAEARRHPYRTLGIALGTGYVLGGGVPRFMVRMATMAALRSLGRAILTSDAVTELARSALGGGGSPRRRVKNGARKRTGGGRFTA